MARMGIYMKKRLKNSMIKLESRYVNRAKTIRRRVEKVFADGCINCTCLLVMWKIKRKVPL